MPPPPLVLGHAINMASAAMQAYLQPATGAAFQRRSAKGVVTQFVSAEFVQTHFNAVLNVTVHTANGFEGADVRPPPPPSPGLEMVCM